MTRTTIQPGPPGRTRRPVLLQDAEDIVVILQANPGNAADPNSGWHLIAMGERSRLGVISQTSYRIRQGKIQAFAESAEAGGGTYETWVSTDISIPHRKAPVELYARWVVG